MMSPIATAETGAQEALPKVRLVRSWRLEGALDFAKALGVSPATVYYVLSGKRRSLWRRRKVRFAAFYVGYILFLAALAAFVVYVMASIPSEAKAWHVGDYESAPNPADTWKYAP